MNPQEHDNSITLSCHRRRGDSRRQTPLDNQAEASWQCPVCNTLSSGMFCPVCGYRQETTLRQKAVPREPRRTPSGITLVLAVSAALVLVLLVFVCIGVFFSSPSHKKVPLSQTDLPSYFILPVLLRRLPFRKHLRLSRKHRLSVQFPCRPLQGRLPGWSLCYLVWLCCIRTALSASAEMKPWRKKPHPGEM